MALSAAYTGVGCVPQEPLLPGVPVARASPAQLLLVAAVSLVIWEQLKILLLLGCREALLLFILPMSHPHCSGLPARQSLFPQGHASCQDAL